MTELFRRIATDPRFTNFITAVILLAGLVVGLETHPPLVERFHFLLDALDHIILFIFIVEIIIKVGAEGRRPWRYFYDPWNVFDFAIVAVCFLPVDAQYIAVLRLARLLRVLKLVRALPRLQILVSALLKSIPSMGYVALLLGMLFYVYAVAAVFIFGANDPIHFGDLPTAMLSLFRVVTGEDWTDVMYVNMWGCDHALYGYSEAVIAQCTQPQGLWWFGSGFFVSFMIIGAMIILNLFIGVIMSGMDEAQRENELAELIRRRLEAGSTLSDDLDQIMDRLNSIQSELAVLKNLSDNPPPDIAAR
ncbi:MAG: voltage-gated sodium channel [Myxococcota bacterium]|jgi:voltage-gated sodium channel